MKTVISTPKAPAAIGPYSQAIRKGGTLYLSGQIGMVPATGELVSNDVKEQAAQALANMKAVLAEAGATPADVTKVTVFIVDMADFQAVNSVYSETFGADAPARSCVAVASRKAKKYHRPSCEYAAKIKDENLVTFDSAAQAQAAGYAPCGACKP